MWPVTQFRLTSRRCVRETTCIEWLPPLMEGNTLSVREIWQRHLSSSTVFTNASPYNSYVLCRALNPGCLSSLSDNVVYYTLRRQWMGRIMACDSGYPSGVRKGVSWVMMDGQLAPPVNYLSHLSCLLFSPPLNNACYYKRFGPPIFTFSDAMFLMQVEHACDKKYHWPLFTFSDTAFLPSIE